jgi:hypothetical protein
LNAESLNFVVAGKTFKFQPEWTRNLGI